MNAADAKLAGAPDVAGLDPKAMDTPAEVIKPRPNTKDRVVYVTDPGFAWNPLRQWPTNEACWCGSGKKAKKCCLPKAVPVLKESLASSISGLMAKGILGRGLVRQSFIEGQAGRRVQDTPQEGPK